MKRCLAEKLFTEKNILKTMEKIVLLLLIVFLFPVGVKAASEQENLHYIEDGQASVMVESSGLDDLEFTQENVMNILNELDPDGAYLVQYGIDNGSDITKWYSEWTFSHAEDILSGIGTAVHEECHSDMFRHHYEGDSFVEGLDYYVGNKDYISVNYTDVYKSEEMAATFPSSLRTFRFDTYVSEGETTSANVNGIYGLLNEFTAYYWNAHTNNLISKKYGVWDQETNIVQPYYEFLYWMTNYMLYAKEHYPQVYKSILNNEDFLEAFAIIEEKYNKEITAYIDKRGDDLGDETLSLKKELANDKYTGMLHTMGINRNIVWKNNSTKSDGDVSGNIVNKTVVSGKTAKKKKLAKVTFRAKARKKKIALTIKKVKNARKYQIQYSLKKNFKNKKTKYTRARRVTLKKLKSKKKYYVRIRAIGSSGQKGKWSKVKTVRVK